MVLKKCPHKDCGSEEITVEEEKVPSKKGFFNPININNTQKTYCND